MEDREEGKKGVGVASEGECDRKYTETIKEKEQVEG